MDVFLNGIFDSLCWTDLKWVRDVNIFLWILVPEYNCNLTVWCIIILHNMNDTSLSQCEIISILSVDFTPLKNILQAWQWTVHITHQFIFPNNFLNNLCQLGLCYWFLTLEISALFGSVDPDIDFDTLSLVLVHDWLVWFKRKK